MTTFDERERGFEARFAHDAEFQFKAEARRDRLVGLWAGGLMGLTGEALENYALSVMRADLAEPGDQDVHRKLVSDLAAARHPISAAEVRARMDALLAQARLEVQDAQPPPPAVR